MKVQCPKCAQRIKISPEVAVALAGKATFDCPSCGGAVPTPSQDEESLHPMAAEQLLMRALQSTNPGGEDWMPPEASELDEVIGDRYHVIAMLGHGGMGAVYKARDTRLDRTVAIKILPEELAQNPVILSRFEREAKSLAALDHPNIVKIHDYGFTTGGSPFFVMEFVKGDDIQSLRNRGSLDLRTALTMVSQVCDAIAYAHERKIIHRDIKPANVMVDDSGRTKVADFGLAKLLETDTRPQHEPGLTITGQVMGTPAYMAPEQESGAPVDHRTDIYALGVMLYNLLTGTPPRGAWSLPSELAPVDSRLDQIVLRALQEKPEARYQSAAEFREDIDSVIVDSGGSALPPGIEPAPLPSTAGGGHATTSRRFANQARTTISLPPPPAEHIEAEFLSTARSLNNTMLILGLLAMTVIGGLALYLANRKTGDVSTVTQTITTSETNNTFLNQLIATGITAGADLSDISAIRPYGEGFVGLSKNTLTEAGALALAEKTGAKILELPSQPTLEIHPPISWLQQNFVSGEILRVARDGKPHLLVGETILPASDPASPHRALLHWNPQSSSSSGQNSVESAGSIPSMFTYTSQGSSVTITGCKDVTPEVSIPASLAGLPVTTIGNNAFLYNPIIQRVIIPETVVNIESYAFFGCEKLAAVRIPASVQQIGGRALGGCGNLAAFDVADANSSFKVMDGVLYSKDGLTLWQYPGGKGGKFSIAEGVSKIGGWAFANSHLVEEIYVPASVTEINAEPFGSCGNLQRIEVSPGNPLFSSRDGVFYNKDETAILQYPGGRAGAFELPSSVVGFDAVFAYANKLTRVTIPASVSRIGDNAFFACSNLARVDFVGDAPQTLGANVFNGTSPGFMVFFQPGAKGFTTPLWNGYPCSESSELLKTPPASGGPLPWTSTDGKTVRAEFVRLEGEAVVIRMNGKDFTIPFSRLTSASIEQARGLANERD